MSTRIVSLLFRGYLICFLAQLLCLVPVNTLFAKESGLKPLRLSYGKSPAKGSVCALHAPTPLKEQAKKTKRQKGRPPSAYESEHRPVVKRSYYFDDHRKSANITAYVRRPDGKVIEPQLILGNTSSISFPTPFGDGPVHGANSVYVVEQGVSEKVLTIRTAKWITMHHSCGWGHEKKFDDKMIFPQPLTTIPFEIVIDKLWDPNFHLSVASGDNLKITVLSYGKPVPEARLTISSEKGWNKQVVTDTDGKATIQMIRDYYPSLWATFKRSQRGEFLVTAHYNVDQHGSFGEDTYDQVKYLTTLPWMYTPSHNDYASYSYGLGLGVLSMTVSGLGVFAYRERRKKPYKGISFNE